MDRILLTLGALSGFLAVLAGGARVHYLDKRLPKDRLPMLEVGMRYQMAHAMAILITALAIPRLAQPLPALAGCGFLLGTLLFSGSMYTFALTGWKPALRLPPIGGIIFLASWLTLALATLTPR